MQGPESLGSSTMVTLYAHSRPGLNKAYRLSILSNHCIIPTLTQPIYKTTLQPSNEIMALASQAAETV